MFGLKIAIGAVDNTTGALRGISGKLKAFSRNVRTWLNLAGFTIIARQLGRALDKALDASSYKTEWSDLKKMMSQMWEGVAGKIGDVFGPMIGNIEELNGKLVSGVESWIDRIRYAIAYWKRALPKKMGGEGQSMDEAAVGAESDLKQAKQSDAMRRDAAEKKAYNQMIQDAADKFASEEEARARNRARRIPEQAEYENTGIFVNGKEWQRPKAAPKFSPWSAWGEASLSRDEKRQNENFVAAGRTIGTGINAWRPGSVTPSIGSAINATLQTQQKNRGGMSPLAAAGLNESALNAIEDNTKKLLEIMNQSFTPNRGQ